MAELSIAIADDNRQTLNLLGEILEKEDGSRLYILVSTQEKRVYFVQITV